MSTQLQLRRGNSTENAALTGAVGEATANTTNHSLHVHDGSTLGGYELLRADLANANAGSAALTTGSLTTGALTAAATTVTTLTASSTLTVGGTTTITGTDDTPLLINTANTNGPHLRFQVSGSSKHFVGSGGGIALGDADDLAVRAFDNLLFSTGNSSTERLRIDSSGRVGVGVNNPEARLHVENYSSGTSIAADAGDVLIVENSSSAMIDIRSPAGDAGGILFSDPDARARGAIYYYHNDGLDSMYFNTAGSSGQMIIDSNGDVQFTSDSDVRLTIGSEGQVGNNTSNWLRGDETQFRFNNAGGGYLFETSGTATLTTDGSHNATFAGHTTLAAGGKLSGNVEVDGYFTASAANGIRFNNNANSANRMILTDAGVLSLLHDSTPYFDLKVGTTMKARLYADANQTILESAANTLILKSASTTAVTIDSSQNVLIGTTDTGANHASDGAYITPDGQLVGRASGIVSYLNRRGSDGQVLQIMKDGTSVGGLNTNGGALVLKGESASAPVQIQSHDGNEDIELDPDGQFIKFETAGSERLRINQYGTLELKVPDSATTLILTPSGTNANATLDFNTPGSGSGLIKVQGTTAITIASNEIIVNQNGNDQDFRIESENLANMLLVNAGTDSVHIGSSNSLGTSLVHIDGTTSSKNGITMQNASTSGSTFSMAFKSSSESVIGSITNDQSNVSFNTSSDYRLKENLAPISDGIERLTKLKPVKFDWKETGISSEGFIAHEVQEAGWVDGITGEKDGKKIQQMDYGRITPLIVKALQEAIEKIETLEAKVKALEEV